MLTPERKIELLEAFASEVVALAQVHNELTGFFGMVSPYDILGAFNRMKMEELREEGKC